MSLATVAGAAVGALAAGMYLDARLFLRNDIRLGNRKLSMALGMRHLAKLACENKLLIYHVLEDRAGTPEGDGLCLLFEGRQWTHTEFYNALQPVANWLLKDLGIKKGEVVAIDGGNAPEYLMLIFALEAIGATPALLNHNLTGDALMHSVKLSSSRYLITDRAMEKLVAPVEPKLKDEGVDVTYYSPTFIETLKDTTPLPKERQVGIDPAGIWALLYTSGTTGLPKGVIFPRSRALLLGRGVAGYLPLKPGDRMYTCLPLYHASALALAMLPVLSSGATLVLGRKFSHATFWPEIHASGTTHIQYVGELCRYLVNAAPGPLDRGHAVRMAWGNGMRADVWERFRERFGIECVNELYAASDGITTAFNRNRGAFTSGALGVRGPLWRMLNRDERRIRVDPDTQEVIRGKDGWAIEAKADEPGELVNRLNLDDPDKGTPQYFNNKSATVKRRISDLFKKGDLWFRSGDLLRLDSQNRLYFVDRLGDTFRWHSENVSTSEVSDVVGKFAQVAEANVYGVLVPNADGRAGCVALVPTDDVLGGGNEMDFAALAAHCLASLPRYAVPLFVRVTKGLEYTGTHKLQKTALRAQGIDLAAIKASGEDQMYWLPPGAKTYVPFAQKDFDEIKAGRVRL
ncbi:fatty-acyl-CoA synthase [Hypoxylon argillaceum]|nr:fatty-acyl-CoA synthase [Hypoxylon argillaceum]